MSNVDDDKPTMYCFLCDQTYTEPSYGGFGICPRCDTGNKPDGTKYTTKELLKLGKRMKAITTLLEQAERKARIDELRRHTDGYRRFRISMTHEDIEDRISALKGEQ